MISVIKITDFNEKQDNNSGHALFGWSPIDDLQILMLLTNSLLIINGIRFRLRDSFNRNFHTQIQVQLHRYLVECLLKID